MKTFFALTICIVVIILVHTMLPKEVVTFLGNFSIGWCVGSLVWKGFE